LIKLHQNQNEIDIRRGIEQRDIISPTLFNLALKKHLNTVECMCCRMNEDQVEAFNPSLELFLQKSSCENYEYNV